MQERARAAAAKRTAKRIGGLSRDLVQDLAVLADGDDVIGEFTIATPEDISSVEAFLAVALHERGGMQIEIVAVPTPRRPPRPERAKEQHP